MLDLTPPMQDLVAELVSGALNDIEPRLRNTNMLDVRAQLEAERELLTGIRANLFAAKAQARFAMTIRAPERQLFMAEGDTILAGDVSAPKLYRARYAKQRQAASDLAQAVASGQPTRMTVRSRSGAYGALKGLCKGIGREVCPQLGATLATQIKFYEEAGRVMAVYRAGGAVEIVAKPEPTLTGSL